MARKKASEDRGAEETAGDSFPITFDPSKGRIFLQNAPVWFMSPEYYVDLQLQLEQTMGKASKGILYRAAEQSGRRIAQMISAGLDPNADDMTRVTILLKIAEFVPTMGHGKVALVIEDLGQLKTAWTMPYSQIAEIRRPSDHPACHFYAGAAAGIVSEVFGRPVMGEEVECAATGGKACVFRTHAL